MVKNKMRFNHNGNSYTISINITLNFWEKYEKNKDRLSTEDLIKLCLLSMNPQLEKIVDELHEKQIVYILNKIIKNSSLSYHHINNINDFDGFMKKYNTKLKEQMKEFAKTSSSLLKSISLINLEIQKSISKPLIKLQDTFKNVTKQLNTFITSIDFSKIENLYDKFSLVLINLGYPPLDIGIEKVSYILEHSNDENICDIIDEIILEEYSIERIECMFKKWTNYTFLDNRIHILREAIDSFNLNKYYTSIPIFFSQLEGSVAVFFGHTDSMNGKKYESYINKILKNKDELLKQDEILKAFFSNIILGQFSHGGDIPKFSRHAILHGGDTLYGTKVKNINSIITFDCIVSTMNEIKNTN